MINWPAASCWKECAKVNISGSTFSSVPKAVGNLLIDAPSDHAKLTPPHKSENFIVL